MLDVAEVVCLSTEQAQNCYQKVIVNFHVELSPISNRGLR